MSARSVSPSANAVRTPRADRVAARRRLLVDLTIKIIREKGFDELSVNELAERASISVGGLYRYIKTKSDLLVMVYDEINLGIDQTMITKVSQVQGATEKLRVAFLAYWNACWDGAQPVLLAYREWQSLPKPAQRRFVTKEDQVAEYFCDLIRTGVASKEFADVNPRLLAVEMVMLAQLKALKGWAVRGFERSEMFADHWQLVVSRLQRAPDLHSR